MSITKMDAKIKILIQHAKIIIVKCHAETHVEGLAS